VKRGLSGSPIRLQTLGFQIFPPLATRGLYLDL
jgi:hypothetical protein